MRRSAVFILIFTIIILAGFYSYDKKSKQDDVFFNSSPALSESKQPLTVTTTAPTKNVVSTITTVPSTSVTEAPVSSSDKMTIDEVSTHNKKNDCYLVIKNKVYDVSSFISQHPGGQGKIISNCGQEVTGIFADIHSNFAWDLLKNYQIGQL